MRNLAIETITTSHFLVIDGDGIISSKVLKSILEIATLENSIQNHIPLLSNDKEILLFPLFPYTSEYHEKCIAQNNCTQAYFNN